MPDNDDHDRDSQEQQRRWAKFRTSTVALFNKAKSILLKKPEFNIAGRDANFIRHNYNARNQYFFIGERNATHVERPQAGGQTNSH